MSLRGYDHWKTGGDNPGWDAEAEAEARYAEERAELDRDLHCPHCGSDLYDDGSCPEGCVGPDRETTRAAMAEIDADVARADDPEEDCPF
jgi:hypothetical protein